MPAVHSPQIPQVAVLPVTSSAKEVAEIIQRDGGVVIQGFVPDDTINQMHKEIGDVDESSPLGGLVGKSRTFAHAVLKHRLFYNVGQDILRDVTYPWWGDTRSMCVSHPVLSVSQAVTLGPQTRGQALHREDLDHQFEHKDGTGETSMLGIFVAATDIHAAAQIVLGSHFWADDHAPASLDQSSTVTLKKGDALITAGSVWYGLASANSSNTPARLYTAHLVKGYLRSEENQILATPREVVKTYDPEVQALLTYSVSQPWCGYVELDDPISMVTEGAELSQKDLMGIIFEGPGSENYEGPKPVIPLVI
ncbi:PhyH-domain-containing protein [Aspergillus venezuelensis]